MTEKEWMHLKSGTDVRGTAVKTDEKEIQLTDETVKKICTAFCTWYREKYNTDDIVIAVGHDCRISSPRISRVAMEAFCACDCKVYDCALASTPSMFMCIVEKEDVNASLEITASHHPFDRNGLKFFTPNGGLEGDDITEILKIAMNVTVPEANGRKPVELRFMDEYCDILRKKIIEEADNGEKPLSGLHIVVDAGNGVGGFYANEVLAPLGADISGSQFLEPDGNFPNHIPNPENKTAIDSASKMVTESSADFGLIFDTDVDRMGCIGPAGEEINRNSLVALAAAIVIESNPGTTVVTDSLTSDGLRDFIENTLGGKQLRYKRGYKNVIDKSIELNNNGIDSALAIETSGHAALKENYFLDDGAYLATKIVIKLAKLKKQGKTVSDLTSQLKMPAESVEIRIPIMLEEFKEYGEKVIADLTEYASTQPGWEIEKENYEGTRINIPGGWFLLRLSVHDPILPLNIENDEPGVCEKIAEKLHSFFSRFDKLDLSNFNK